MLFAVLPVNKTQRRQFFRFRVIRQLAIEAGANFDDYIEKIVVVEKLKLSMLKAGGVVEIMPGAEDVPENNG